MSGRGWYVLDGRRILAGPFATDADAAAAVPAAKAWLHQDLRELGRTVVVTDEEIRERLRAVRVEFGVRASRGGFKRLPKPSAPLARGA